MLYGRLPLSANYIQFYDEGSELQILGYAQKSKSALSFVARVNKKNNLLTSIDLIDGTTPRALVKITSWNKDLPKEISIEIPRFETTVTLVVKTKVDDPIFKSDQFTLSPKQ